MAKFLLQPFTVEFELTGRTPLIMHACNIDAAERIKEWQVDPANKNFSVPGDDRSPPWIWLSYLYHDDQQIVVPYDNIFRCLLTAATRVILKGARTYKELVAGGILPQSESFPLLLKGKPIPVADLLAMWEDSDIKFSQHCKVAEQHGFTLFSKRAQVKTSKPIRTRPKFTGWSIRGSFQVAVEELTFEVMDQIFQIACGLGLCDWRPSEKISPGPYGTFTHKLKFVKPSKSNS